MTSQLNLPITEHFYTGRLSTKELSAQSSILVTRLDYWEKCNWDEDKTSAKCFATLFIVEGTATEEITIEYADGTQRRWKER